MSFMEAQMTDKVGWYAVECNDGSTEYLDISITPTEIRKGIYTEAFPMTINYVEGYGVRSSAPGYLDCTPWEVYATKREALKAYNQHKRENKGDDY